jgi:hypothetical protein
MKFPRIYTDEHGETHIGSREMPQHEARVGPPPNPLGLMTEIVPVSGFFAFTAPAGTQVPPHPAPEPYVCIVLSGEGEVIASDGATLRLRAGELVFCDDVSGKGHTTRTLTDCCVAFISRPGA